MSGPSRCLTGLTSLVCIGLSCVLVGCGAKSQLSEEPEADVDQLLQQLVQDTLNTRPELVFIDVKEPENVPEGTSCGPFSVAATLNHLGHNVYLSDINKQIHPIDGRWSKLPNYMERYLRQFAIVQRDPPIYTIGVVTGSQKPDCDALRAHLRDGHVAIAVLRQNTEESHAVVVNGYATDLEGKVDRWVVMDRLFAKTSPRRMSFIRDEVFNPMWVLKVRNKGQTVPAYWVRVSSPDLFPHDYSSRLLAGAQSSLDSLSELLVPPAVSKTEAPVGASSDTP